MRKGEGTKRVLMKRLIAKTKIFVGIDPGLDGAVTFLPSYLYKEIQEIQTIKIFDAPVLVVQNGKKKKREYNLPAMASLLALYVEINNTFDFHVALEKVHSMPGQGVRSMFSMGEGYGIWKGLIAMTGWPITLVTPQRWKKIMLEGMGKEKDGSRLRALQLFPQLSDKLSRKKDHGRADSLLIAKFLQEFHL